MKILRNCRVLAGAGSRLTAVDIVIDGGVVAAIVAAGAVDWAVAAATGGVLGADESVASSTGGALGADGSVAVATGGVSGAGEPVAAVTAGAEVIDCDGAFATAGLVDLHVHLREPGFAYKETVASGTAAAARGGFTTVCAMPNLDPAPDTPEHLALEQAAIARDAVVRVLPYATITQGRTSDVAVDFRALADAGAFAFSNDGSGVATAGAMLAAMTAAAGIDKAIVAHVEDATLMAGGVMRASARQVAPGLDAWSPLVESVQLARDLELAAATGVHYHVCHVSTARSVALIREAKSRGVRVTAEVTPHHLLLTTDDVATDDGRYKMNPPLSVAEDRDALLVGLLDGTIDCIATDHAPHAAAEKSGGFAAAAFGITGSETAFATLYTRLVRPGRVTLSQLTDWLSAAPARIFGLTGAGRLAVGATADIALFDLEHAGTVATDDFVSMGKNSPFVGWEVYGATVMTLLAGEVVYAR